jgi:glycerophosphoryl diester phosphodiesterase
MALVIAHRGFSARHTENTLPAIQAAIRLGVDLIEIDVQETKDGQLIVFHDDRLDRLCGRSGRVCETTLATIQRLNPAVPTFDQVLRHCRGKARLLIEIKRADPRQVAERIRAHRLTRRVIVFTLAPRRLAIFQRAAPEIETYALVATASRRPAPSVTGIAIHRRLLRSSRAVRRLQRRGWKVFVWTVNREPEMRRWLAWGVDGLITDHPDRALAVRAARR